MERTKPEVVNVKSCKKFARTIFGMQQTPFFVPQYKYTEESAKLARNIFESRTDLEYLTAVHCALRFHDADVIEAAGILADTSLYNWPDYDTIAEVASTEVAGYLQYVNGNKAESVFRSTANLLSQLCVCNTMKMYGPIFIVLARALTTARMIGAQPNASVLGRNSVSYAAHLWSAYHTIQELKRACVNTWSAYTDSLFNSITPIIKNWKQNALISTISFKGAVSWKLDTEVTKDDREYSTLLEV